MIRMSAIPMIETKPRSFGLFTSKLSAAALFGICMGMASILFDKI
jgi:hypothetical protein